jgi:IclR family acetate operon transcriptional repressor
MSRSTMEGGATARRALRILEAVATAPGSSLADVMARVELNKSTAYRLLRILEDEAYVERTTDNGFALGHRMLGLAAAALPQFDMYSALRPTLRSLMRSSGETVTVHRRSGDVTILVLASENEEHAMRLVATIGEARPVWRGSAGLAQLAFADASDISSVLERAVPLEDRTSLRRRLTQIHTDGYAISQGENHPGVHGIAVPLRATDETMPKLSLAVSGPALRWSKERMLDLVPELLSAQADIAQLLGFESSLANITRTEARS